MPHLGVIRNHMKGNIFYILGTISVFDITPCLTAGTGLRRLKIARENEKQIGASPDGIRVVGRGL
jgi:hypothetical protein